MSARFVLSLALSSLLVGLSPLRAADDKATTPALVVRIKSLEGLVGDIKYLTALAGREEEGKQAEGIFQNYAKGGSLMGIDTKRPLGSYGIVTANATDSYGVVLIPVADEKMIVDTLNQFNLEAKKDADGIYTVTPPGSPFPVYFRFADRYAYVTARDKAALAKENMLKVAAVLPANTTEAFAASFRIDQVPDLIKQIALGQFELKMAEAQEKKEPGETEAQHAFKVQTLKLITQRVTTLFNEGGEVSIKVSLDQKANKIVIDSSLAGMPKSSLATEIASTNTNTSAFGGLVGGDAAMSGLIHALLPEGLRTSFNQALEQEVKKGLEKEKDAAKRQAAESFFKALQPTLKTGELDAAVSLRGPSASGQFTFLAAFKVADGPKIEAALRELIQADKNDRESTKFDVDSAGAVKIHRITIRDGDAGFKRSFGDAMYFAVRPDAILFSAGAEGIPVLKAGLATSPKPSPQIQFELSMARVAALMALDKSNKGDPKAAAAKAFTGPAKDNDKIRVTVQGGQALQGHFEMGSPVITFFALVDKAQKEGK